MRRRRFESGVRRFAGRGVSSRPARWAPVFERGSFEQAGDRPLVDDLSPLVSRPGPEVDHVIRAPDQLRVVLHHDHRVAGLGQASENSRQPPRVSRVQPHRRLVEDVEGAGERASEGGGQRHPLGLAPGEGARLSAEREVSEAGVDQEPQASLDLLKELLGGGVLPGDRPRAEHALGVVHRERLDLGERPSVDAVEPRLGVEPGPVAIGAAAVAAEAREIDAHVHAVGA